MKKTKVLATLSCGLIAVLGLAACAGPKVTPEEGKATLKAMNQAYEDETVKEVTKWTVKISMKGEHFDGETTEKINTASSSSVDTENYRYYSKTVDDKETTQTWIYFAEDRLYTATIDAEGAKKYSSLPCSKKTAGALFKTAIGAANLSYVGQTSLATANAKISSLDEKDEDSLKIEYGKNATFEIKKEWRSNKKDALEYAITVAHKNGAYKTADGVSEGKVTWKVAIDSYALKGFSETISHKITKDGKTTYSNNTKQELSISHKAKVSVPNVHEDGWKEIGL